MHKNSVYKILCILFNEGILSQKLERSGVQVEIIDEKKYSSLKIIKKCINCFKVFRPSILHVHRNKEHFIGMCTKIACGLKIPVFRTVHGKTEVARGLKFTQHIRSSTVVWLDHLLINRYCDYIIAVSNEMTLNLQNAKINGSIISIPNAIEPEAYTNYTYLHRIRELYHTTDCFWIGTAARLAVPKNLYMLIRAASVLSKDTDLKFKISIFGDGPLKSSLTAYIQEMGLTKIVFLHGFQPDVLRLIATFDIFVLTSFHEGLPMALLEAMVLSKPIICTAVGGMKEVIEDGTTGLLVVSDDHIALAEKTKILYNDSLYRDKLGENAKCHVVKNFGIQAAVHMLAQTYTQHCRKSNETTYLVNMGNTAKIDRTLTSVEL